MKWMIEVTVCIFVTSITGTILFGIWYLVGKLLEKTGFINVMYELLKAVLLFWFLPVSYMVLFICNHKRWGGFLFRYTRVFGIICIIFIFIWGVMAIRKLYEYIGTILKIRNSYKKAVPVGEDIYEMFLSICEELDIRKDRVDLVYDEKTESPCMGGWFKCYIFLPTEEYTDEHIRTILLHELVHYKQRNHIMRHFTEIAGIIHCLNPFYGKFTKKVHYWGEHACDFEVIPKMKSAKQYLRVLLDLSSESTSDNDLGSFLYGSKEELETRINLVKRSYKMKKSKVLAFVIVLFMVTLSTTSVQAATEGAGDAYYNYFFETSHEVRADGEEVEGVEYTADGFERGVIVHKEPFRLINPLDLTGYNWTIKANRAQSSYDFKVRAGQTVSVTCSCSPQSAQFRMGIVEPNGTLRYVTSSGSASHNFSISSDGKYAIYVQNMSDGSISVAGYYNVE